MRVRIIGTLVPFVQQGIPCYIEDAAGTASFPGGIFYVYVRTFLFK